MEDMLFKWKLWKCLSMTHSVYLPLFLLLATLHPVKQSLENHLGKGGLWVEMFGAMEGGWGGKIRILLSGMHDAHPLKSCLRTLKLAHTARSPRSWTEIFTGQRIFFFSHFSFWLLAMWQKWHLLIPNPTPAKYSFHCLIVYMYSPSSGTKINVYWFLS